MALCRCCVCVHGNGNGKSNTIIQRISGWLAEVKVELQSTMTINYASRRSRTRDTVKLTVCVCVCVSVCLFQL